LALTCWQCDNACREGDISESMSGSEVYEALHPKAYVPPVDLLHQSAKVPVSLYFIFYGCYKVLLCFNRSV